MLSVIIPVYNVARWLARCLDSVVLAIDALGGIVEAEIICIDDGSTDDGGLILDKYAEKDSRFRIHHQANRGLSETRQVGLELAKGEFIAWVDSDDWVDKEHFLRLYEAAVSSGVDIVCCDVVKEYDGRSEVTDQFCGADDAIVMQEAILKRDVLAAVWNRLYRRDAIDKSGAFFAPRSAIPIMEDTFFNSRFLASKLSVAHIHSATYHYVIREGSLSNKGGSLKWWTDVVCANNSIERNLEGLADKEVLRYRWAMFKSWMFRNWNVTDELFYGFHPEIKALPKGMGSWKGRALFYFVTKFHLRNLLRRMV